MGVHRIKKGLDLPITGEPETDIVEDAPDVSRYAVLAGDYVGLKPRMQVQPGDRVARGQVLFEDRRTPGLRYTASGAGVVDAVNRGERRALESVVVRLDEDETDPTPGSSTHVRFECHRAGTHPADMEREEIRDLLVESGLFTAFRTRPFSKVPDPSSIPHAIFVTAMDTNPLAPPAERTVEGREEDVTLGLLAVAKLTPGKVYVCRRSGSSIGDGAKRAVTLEDFEGVHPAGTVGLHIHLLDPVDRERTVWHLGIQDVAAVGWLVRTGTLFVDRVVSLAGPPVKRPRLLRTRLGASLDDLVADELAEGENRVISGSVLSGRKATGPIRGYLGRYHQQITVIREGREREFFGWLAPGRRKFSIFPVFLSKLLPRTRFDFTSTTNGSDRAIVPIGMYEQVMPFDILPTFLLRALAVRDVESAEKLGCLELDEEDLALSTFVCPGKGEYGPMLREVLQVIEEEG